MQVEKIKKKKKRAAKKDKGSYQKNFNEVSKTVDKRSCTIVY